jgi:DNA-binding MarR family transcriptional regulator
MADTDGLDFKNLIFDYINEFKFILFPDQWTNAFMDYSKNEVLVLLFLYSKKHANMTEISEYISSPLNTATGVVARLEKKLMVERQRGNEDRRIVNIVLTKHADEFIDHEIEFVGQYFNKVCSELTQQEKAAAVSIFNKVLTVLRKGRQEASSMDNPTKRVKRIIVE